MWPQDLLRQDPSFPALQAALPSDEVPTVFDKWVHP